MFQKRRYAVFMSALGVALSAGAAVVATAVDTTEKFVVTGALKVTHTITEQVCDFDSLAALENFLANIADAHQWFRHDQPAAAPATDDAGQLADHIDTTAAQFDALATTSAPAVDAPAAVTEAAPAPAPTEGAA